MFRDTKAFDQPLNEWNTSSVLSMEKMFARTSNFNQPLNDWDTSSVTDMRSMFSGARSFNRDLCDWGPDMATAPQPRTFGMIGEADACESKLDPTFQAPDAFMNFCASVCAPRCVSPDLSDCECTDGANPCTQEGRVCVKTEGSFTCGGCAPGFTGPNGDGTCQNVDECANTALNNCDLTTSTCADTEGSFECECLSGFALRFGYG